MRTTESNKYNLHSFHQNGDEYYWSFVRQGHPDDYLIASFKDFGDGTYNLRWHKGYLSSTLADNWGNRESIVYNVPAHEIDGIFIVPPFLKVLGLSEI